jgi:hypothetical protein
MNINLKSSILIEGKNLDLNELFKERTPNRIDVLVDKIENEQPITLMNGQTAILDRNKNAELLKILKTKNQQAITQALKKGQVYSPVFVDKHGNQYSLAHFAKTAEFGSSAGVRGGQNIETLSEVGQMLALGIVSNLGRPLDTSDLTLDNLTEATSKLAPSGNFKPTYVNQILSLITEDKKWAKSFTDVANALNANLKLKNKVFHRDTEWTANLYLAWKQANAAMEPKPFSTNINKWNPADIWIVNPKVVVPSDVADLNELNQWLIEQYKTNDVYGISLKKVHGTANVSVHNLDPIGDHLKIAMRELIVTKSGDIERLFTSQDTYMKYEAMLPLSMYYSLVEAGASDQIQYRSFGGGAIQGEIQGKRAAHGKIGFGSINAVLRTLTGESIADFVKVRAMISTPEGKKNVVKHLIEMAEEVMQQKAKKTLVKEGMDWSNEKLISKYQAVQLLYHVHNFRKKNKKKADQFLTSLFQYASSQTPLSSVFVKVS